MATTTTSTTEVELSGSLEETARLCFELVVKDTTEDNLAAEPESPAETYYWYFQTIGAAMNSSSIISEPSSMSVDGEVVKVTTGDQTIDFADIVVSDQGVRTFTVNGKPLEELLTIALPVVAGPITIDRSVSYLSAGGAHVTAVMASNTSDETITLNNWSAQYVNSSNEQIGPLDSFGPLELRPGASAAYGWVWGGNDPVGTIYLDGFDADFTNQFDLKLEFTYGY